MLYTTLDGWADFEWLFKRANKLGWFSSDAMWALYDWYATLALVGPTPISIEELCVFWHEAPLEDALIHTGAASLEALKADTNVIKLRNGHILYMIQ